MIPFWGDVHNILKSRIGGITIKTAAPQQVAS
jgi:hypothetical protein